MNAKGNPWDTPEWHFVGRECRLVRNIIGSGITALGKANYADKLGEYYVAFFGLTVGLERLAKLILVADYAITNSGQMPNEKLVRKHGHKIADLLVAVGKVQSARDLRIEYLRPTTPVATKIVECLDAFADASRGRYANFAGLGDPNLGRHEPIEKWWAHVAEQILQIHYRGKKIQRRIEDNAAAADALFGDMASVRYFDEGGTLMDDMVTASTRTGQTAIVQRYGRYHSLTIVRWLADVYCALTKEAAYTHNVDAFFGTWEFLETYAVPDPFLRDRKKWPL